MTHCPEQSLWQEVLLRQVDDALNGPAGVSGIAERERAVKAARSYLTMPSASLHFVCTAAGIEPGALLDAMHKKIAAAPSPFELAANRKINRASATKRVRDPRPKQVKCADRLITFDGNTLTMQQWADLVGLSVAQIASRLRQDWSVERALTQPVGTRSRTWGASGAVTGKHAPGVGCDFLSVEGTGGGRSAQDSPKINFSNKEGAI